MISLPLVSSVDLQSGTTLNTSISNTSMTFNGLNISVETLTLEPTYFLLSGISYTRSNFQVSNISNVINFSTPNSNFDSGGLPYLTLNTPQQKNIQNNLSTSVNLTGRFNVTSCYITSLSYQGLPYPISCSNNIITLNLNNVPTSSSTLIITYDYQLSPALSATGLCSVLPNGLSNFSNNIVNVMIILGVIFIISFVAVMVYMIKGKEDNIDAQDFANVGSTMTIFLFIFIVVAFVAMLAVGFICLI